MPSSKLLTIAQPASGSIYAEVATAGPNHVRITLTLDAARMTVTDAAGSGSYGALTLATLTRDMIFRSCSQNYTAFAEGAALTGAAGDAAFDIGVGSVAKAAAADGALGGATDDDIGGEIAVTLSGGTATAALINSCAVLKDVSASATISLNVSGSAATIDATSTLDVTGTITMLAEVI